MSGTVCWVGDTLPAPGGVRDPRLYRFLLSLELITLDSLT